MRDPATIIVALERECLKVDAAIEARRWPVCDASWRTQRRLTHELDIALRAIPRDSPDYAEALNRIDRLRRYRDGQLKRLRTLHDSIGKRLATFERFRTMARTVGGRQPRSFLIDIDS
jgi:hypothetical protein